MVGFLLRVLRSFRAEIVLGFLVATIFWAGVLGWQAAYAPNDAQKQECYEAAKKEGHRSEECKAFWEKATSDPVAFFTLWLVIFTGGLTVSTILLWRAGERQIELLREGGESQSRDMQASVRAATEAANAAIASNQIAVNNAQQELRAWVGYTHYIMGALGDSNAGNATHIGLRLAFKNDGKTPALGAICLFDLASAARSFPDGEPAFDAALRLLQMTAPVAPGATFNSPFHYFTLEDIIQSHGAPIIMRGAVRYDTIFPTISNCVTDMSVSVEYIGRAGIEQLRRGEVTTENFVVIAAGTNNNMS